MRQDNEQHVKEHIVEVPSKVFILLIAVYGVQLDAKNDQNIIPLLISHLGRRESLSLERPGTSSSDPEGKDGALFSCFITV